MPSLNRSGKKKIREINQFYFQAPLVEWDSRQLEAVVCQHLLGVDVGQCGSVSFHLLHEEHSLLPQLESSACQTPRCGLGFLERGGACWEQGRGCTMKEGGGAELFV